MQFAFGSGLMWGTPLFDASGNAITNPTPVLFGVLQEGGIEISGDLKSLYGQNQFPVAVGRGKGKVTGTAKFGQIFAELYNNVFFGQTLTTGLISARYDTTGAAIPTTPFEITPTPPASGTWSRDLGVISSTGVPFRRVASAPTAGQYSVSAGVYTFAAADVGQTVYINFEYTASTAGAQKQTVMNLPMGYAPAVSVDLFVPYEGKTLKVRAMKAVFSKLSMATRQDDFMVSDSSFECFADAAGKVLEWSTSE